MNTSYQAKLSDRKEKARKSSLQWLFSDRAGDTVHYISGKREMGVSSKKQEVATGKPGGHQRSNNDGLPGSLLGSLLLDSFFGGLLTSAFHGVNMISVAAAADEIWLDRRVIAAAPQPEASYFPY